MKNGMGFGLVSLLSAFFILTMAAFALLGLRTAQTDLKLSEQAAQAVTDRATAEETARRLLVDIEASAAKGGMPRVLKDVPQVSSPAENRGKIRVPCGENQVLLVEFSVNSNEITKEKWQLVNAE